MDRAGVRPGIGGSRARLFLASSSVAALLVGAGPALAIEPCYTGPFPFTNNGALGCIVVNATSFSGNLVNSGTGTISPGSITGTGINVTGSTITGQISNAGTISVGGTGILIQSNAVVTNGIVNSGTISAGGKGNGVYVNGTVAAFAGGISNSGAIFAGGSGIRANP